MRRAILSIGFAPLLLAGSSAALEIGSPAPDFAVNPIEGAAFRFADAARTHAAVVVVFFSVVCPYSNYADDHLRELDARYGPRSVLFIGIDSNRTETVEEVAEHARKSGQTYPSFKDEDNRVADLLGARVTPEAFVFDRDGRLRYRGRVRSKMGATDLQAAIEAVVAGQPVKTTVAKAFGCAIVRARTK
jgi:thiol-disulfide isomerase/thioredoxin